jgi:hypothetical protein
MPDKLNIGAKAFHIIFGTLLTFLFFPLLNGMECCLADHYWLLNTEQNRNSSDGTAGLVKSGM